MGATTSEPLIRRAGPADADGIGDLWLASFRATYAFPVAHPDADVRRWLREEVVTRAETFVAVQPDGLVVGFMSMQGEDLDQLYVLPGHFDRGIGSRLLQLAKELRPEGLFLYTFQANEHARAFYERRGFRAVAFGDGAHNEEHQPDVRYHWDPDDMIEAPEADTDPPRRATR